MRGTIVQISTSRGGVPKYAIPEGTVTRLGVEGDVQAHPQFHGGPGQAILLISAEDIDALRGSGFPVFYGALGENLTVRGIDFRQVRVGQRFRVGDTILEITKLRQPCSQLNPYGPEIQAALHDAACKAGDVRSPVWGKGGFYASVTKTGLVRPNDIIELLDQAV
jgi:MOSC domain-containing protein YiiM